MNVHSRVSRCARVIVGVTALLATPRPAQSQEIIQAVVLDLTVVEVQVIVAGTRGDERLECVVRTAEGRTRVVATRAVSAGFASGRTTVLSLVLPLLDPQEKEFSVVLVRGDAVLDRTKWKILFARQGGRA